MSLSHALIALLLACLLLAGTTLAEDDTMEVVGEFLEGRAASIVVWAMPLVSTYSIKEAILRDLSADVNQIIKWNGSLSSKQAFLTPNSNSPYVMSILDTSIGGPVKVSIPAATDTISLSGSFVDAWQRPLGDVGPTGLDEGLGGDFILIPSDSTLDLCNPEVANTTTTEPETNDAESSSIETDVDCASIHRLDLDTVIAGLALRPVLKLDADGSPLASADEIDAFIRQIRIETMTESVTESASGDTVFVDVNEDTEMDTLPPDTPNAYFTLLHAALRHELAPEDKRVSPRDLAFFTMVDSVMDLDKDSFEFPSDKEMKEALEEGYENANAYIRHVLETRLFTPFYSTDEDADEENRWMTMVTGDDIPDTSFETDTRFFIDLRAALYSFATFVPKNYAEEGDITDKFSYYLMLYHDEAGEPLSCSERYSLSVPKDVPAKDFWAVNAYDADTNAFIKDAAVVGVTSQDGVEPPIEILLAPPDADASGEDDERMLLPTGSSCDSFFLIMRFYGPLEPLATREWVMPNAIREEQVEMET